MTKKEKIKALPDPLDLIEQALEDIKTAEQAIDGKFRYDESQAYVKLAEAKIAVAQTIILHDFANHPLIIDNP